MNISSLLHYYAVFIHHAGKKLHALVLIMLVGGLIEGLGVGMFIPLLSAGAVVPTKADAASGMLRQMLSLLGIRESFLSILLFIMVVFLLKGFIMLVQAALSAHITATLTKDLRRNLVSLLVRTNYVHFLRMDTGFLTNIVATESDRAVASFGHYANTLVSLVYVFVYAAVCAFINWQAALLVGALGVVTLVSLRAVHRLSREYSVRTSERNARLQELLIQTIQFFKYLRATNSFPELTTKLNLEIRSLGDYMFRLGVVNGALRSVGEPLGVVVVVVLLYVHVSLLGQPVASLLVLAFVFYRMMTKFMSVQTNWQKFNSSVGGLDEFARTFEKLSQHLETDGTRKVTEFRAALELRHLNFFYGERQILFDINMVIRKNQTIAIVGKTGSGKSTVVDLILGVIASRSGDILFDGISYRDLDKASLRRLVGYVTQESVIFHDSIANNISLWQYNEEDPESGRQVTAAARAAHVDEFIQETDQGYATILGDRGSTVSGGQRQQICIARELFKEPEILVLDEATSALDAKSAWLIQKSLDQVRGSQTIIIITHRLSTVKGCDYVYVLDEGRIVEEGTYEELYSREDSRFAELARLQSV